MSQAHRVAADPGQGFKFKRKITLFDRVFGRPRRSKSEELAQSAPIFLMIGSISGCTRSDAVAYARGLAEKFATAYDKTWIRVKEDSCGTRYLFEVHEGGAGLSILEACMTHLEQGASISVRLADNKSVTIEGDENHIYSLISSDVDQTEGLGSRKNRRDDDVVLHSIETLVGTQKMDAMFTSNHWLTKVGVGILVLNLVALSVASGVYALTRAGYFDDDALIKDRIELNIQDFRDNPVFHLQRAKTEAFEQDKRIKTLTKKNQEWEWELD